MNASDVAFGEVQKARTGKSLHVVAGQSAEVSFVDVMTRLRKYIESRAPRTDKVKIAQGKGLIQPLLDALAKLKAEERARGTRKENAKKDEGAPAPNAPQTPAPTAGSTQGGP